MAYASAADMLRYFGKDELAQRGAPLDASVTGNVMEAIIEGGTVDSNVYDAATDALTKINQALEDASVLIDSYLAARYPTPITDSDGTEPLRRPCADLARCDLFTHGIPEDLAKRCEQIHKWLRDIAKGLVSLPFADNDDETGTLSSRPMLRVS